VYIADNAISSQLLNEKGRESGKERDIEGYP